MLTKILIVGGFFLFVYILIIRSQDQNRGGGGVSNSKGNKGLSGNIDSQDMLKAAKIMQDMQEKQNIERLKDRYRSDTAPKSGPPGGKLNRPL